MRVVRLITDPRRCRSVEALRCMGGGRVLDFGCGYGGVSLQLSKMFDQVVSLEESIDRLSFLSVVREQDQISNIVPVCHNDPAHLPFPDHYFDAVVLIGVLEYLPQSIRDVSPLRLMKYV